jgi:hypothetical protein
LGLPLYRHPRKCPSSMNDAVPFVPATVSTTTKEKSLDL